MDSVREMLVEAGKRPTVAAVGTLVQSNKKDVQEEQGIMQEFERGVGNCWGLLRAERTKTFFRTTV